MTTERHHGGIASGLDVGRARKQLEDRARAALSEAQGAARALRARHRQPCGRTGVEFFALAPPAVIDIHLPNIPTGLPSTLLERRPDIAAAERHVASANNAGIGVARAAFFPSITLNASGGFQDTGQPTLLTAPNLFWSIGPNLVATLFDGGVHEAQLDVAKAEYSEAVGAYRASALQAFQDVEDNLALLNHLAEAADSQQKAVNSASHTEDLSLARYQMGAANYLDVVTAQAAALQAKQQALIISTSRLEVSIRLIKALGGGWTAQDIPPVSEVETASATGVAGGGNSEK